VDVEGSMYRYCREVGITLFTVSHRRSLWKHHEVITPHTKKMFMFFIYHKVLYCLPWCGTDSTYIYIQQEQNKYWSQGTVVVTVCRLWARQLKNHVSTRGRCNVHGADILNHPIYAT
jgi:hypothetical protein